MGTYKAQYVMKVLGPSGLYGCFYRFGGPFGGWALDFWKLPSMRAIQSLLRMVEPL